MVALATLGNAMKYWTRLGLVLGVMAMGVLHAQKPAAEMSAATAQRVHPLLIRNELNPVLRLVLSAPGEEARLQSVQFTLAGTDDLADLDTLELFSTGDRTEFSSAVRFGRLGKAALTVEFSGDAPLRRGTNVFWLSCRLKPAADLLHRVGTACSSIETSAGRITPTNLSPTVRHRIGVALRKHNDDGVHTYRIPALATTAHGTLLAVYDMRRRASRDLQEDIDIGLSRSVDSGRSWEPVRVIMDMGEYGGLPQDQNGCSDPGIIVDRQTGEIFCFAVWMNGKQGKHQWNGDGSEPGYEIGESAQFLLVRSRDDGRTWSPPENLTRQLKKEAWWLFAPSPQQGIQLADGTLVMPAQGRDENGKEFSTLMASRDHGTNWSVGTPAYLGGSECQVVQLGDGSLMINMRNEYQRFRAVAVTADLGQTWRPHATDRNTLIEPNCNGSLLRVDYQDSGGKKHAPHTTRRSACCTS
jgi:sialidase-1